MTKIARGRDKTFIEKECVVHFGNGKAYGKNMIGACVFKAGAKRRGVFYAYESQKKVGTWDGKKKVSAIFGFAHRGNMGDTRQQVYFIWEGVHYSGTYYKSGSDVIRAREVPKSTYDRAIRELKRYRVI